MGPVIENEQEARRLASLHSLQILDTPPEPSYDEIVRLATVVCETPIAQLSFIDRDRRWLKAKVGLRAVEVPREIAFCSQAIPQEGFFQVSDAKHDSRFADNPQVTGEPFIRFYAGFPISSADGANLGMLAVLDRMPRMLTPLQVDVLRVLAAQVSAQLALRKHLTAAVEAKAELRASEERFRAFMDNTPAVAFMKDSEGRMVYFNQPYRERFRLSDNEWIGKTDFDVWPAEVARQFRENDLAVMDGGKPVKLFEEAPTPDGHSRHWQVFKFPLTDSRGDRFLAGMALDVTQERLAEQLLRESEERFRGLVEQLAEGFCLVDGETGAVVAANAALWEMLGYTLGALRRLTIFDITAEHERCHIRADFERARHEGRCSLGSRRYLRRDGSVVDVCVSISFTPQAEKQMFSLILRDATEQRQFEERLLRHQCELESTNIQLLSLASTDALTGIKNRRVFQERLSEEFERAKRHGRTLSLLVCDIDRFKDFNDAFGHPAGDEALVSVARRLKEAAREPDVVARFGGEEFAILLPDTDEAGSMVLAERVRRAIATTDWRMRAITISVGAATTTAATATTSQLLAEADAALYRAKNSGRNRSMHAARRPPTVDFFGGMLAGSTAAVGG